MSNKPQVHAELIKAWAEGAEIEYYSNIYKEWKPTKKPVWSLDTKYRIQPKDIIKDYHMYITSAGYINIVNSSSHINNIRFTFDSNTGKLIDAEVINND